MSRGEQLDLPVWRSPKPREKKSRLPCAKLLTDKPAEPSSLATRNAAPASHTGTASGQKKNTRLPGPSKASAAGSGVSKAQGASNLNRRSQSFTSIDKGKPLQYASGNDREAATGIPQPGSMNGSAPPPAPTPTGVNGQQLVSAIPSPTASKPWRSKSMNMKHSATSSMLAVKTPSPVTSPTPPSGPGPGPGPGSGLSPDRLRPPLTEASKSAGGGQRSMMDRFRLLHGRPSSRPVAELPLQEEETLSELGEDVPAGPDSVCSSPRLSAKASNSGNGKSSSKAPGGKSPLLAKEKEDKGKVKCKAGALPKEEKEQPAEPSKKNSKIGSLIPKGGKSSAVKKEGNLPASSGIPKPGLKAASPGGKATGGPSGLSPGAREPEKPKLTKGSQTFYAQRSLEGRRASMVSSSSTSALSGAMVTPGSTQAANGAVQLPQQQHSHPNTATVAPFMYRTCSENDCTSVVPPDSCLSPTKGGLVYSKTAKQCLEEISGEDPETRRMRTVKNIADLRQNLEETMSSLRGAQLSHSTLETTFDSTVTTEVNGRGLAGLASRSSPMSWRLGQSPSPRLQAGDAPSLPSGYPAPRPAPSARFTPSDSSRFMYAPPLRRASGPRAAELGEKGGPEGGTEVEVAGYMSDGDILGKNVRLDEVTSGYLTDGGLNLYSRNVVRGPEPTSTRDTIQRGVGEVQMDPDSWDDSSSISSGLSDTLDNISTDDLNTSSYTDISASPRKSASQVKTDSHKRAATVVAPGHDSAPWPAGEDLKKLDEELCSAMDSRWKPSSSSGASPGHSEDPDRTGQKTGLPLSQTGSWRRGMTAQLGVTSSRTKTPTGALKTPGKTDDAKASEKGKAPAKGTGIQRSPSDAGKSSGDEGKKPPSGVARPPTTGSFGFKKVITGSGATLAGGSATLGKLPKTSALGKGGPAGAVNGVRKTSLDEAQPQDDGALLSMAASRTPLQYRSLPRPAKSSASGIVGRASHRSSSSSVDSNVSGKSAPAPKRRDGSKAESDRSSPVTVNQTDKEKVAVSDSEGTGLTPKSSPTSTGQSGLRLPGPKYPDIASPTFRRLFGSSKSSSKASSPGTPDSGKAPSALGSPHGPLARQVSLDSPSSGTGSMSSGQSGGSSPLYARGPELTGTAYAPSPSPSQARLTGNAPGGQGGAGLHATPESMDLAVSHHSSLAGLASGPKVTRTGSVKSTLSEGMPLDRNTLPKKGLRYPPTSRQTSQEEGKEWLRSHSTGGLQDTGSQSPLSPPGTSATASKYHYSNLLSPTNPSQFALPGTSMSRSNSIPAQDLAFDLRAEAHALGGSATSLEERPRGISRSGSFRDSTEEVHGSSLSLVSSTSSLYSATEEKAHSEQIRKLRRELDASQEKVAKLTSQLSSNAHLVAAFEKSLANMTCRLQSLTMTAEQKESELAELRETIEALKTQNTDAQTAIQVALNGPDHAQKDLRIRRQHSSDSMSSINSGASHSSVGSATDVDAKKKKKKNWLRSSFKQAFGSKKKSTKPPSSHSDIEEQTDSSQPSSPKLQHAARQGSMSNLRASPSSSELCECTEAEAEIILQLKNELREKELKLTDIRLEALSSAHHLDQIREAMNRMQVGGGAAGGWGEGAPSTQPYNTHYFHISAPL
uniref:Neuron navigator 3 n=1 Tax=Paramormyrops kingsleyae TaxID=1676925 RepID=A0A3B3QAD5_9TELE